MTTWAAGDQAVCVDARDVATLTEGALYSVVDVYHRPGATGLYLAEAEPTDGSLGFWDWRFRKVEKHDAPEKRRVMELA